MQSFNSIPNIKPPDYYIVEAGKPVEKGIVLEKTYLDIVNALTGI